MLLSTVSERWRNQSFWSTGDREGTGWPPARCRGIQSPDGSSSSMSRWRLTLDSSRIHSGEERHRSLARFATGRTRSGDERPNPVEQCRKLAEPLWDKSSRHRDQSRLSRDRPHGHLRRSASVALRQSLQRDDAQNRIAVGSARMQANPGAQGQGKCSMTCHFGI
jgi:hypothetical protein